MFIPRVYYPYEMKEGTVLFLNKETSHYLCTVLRLSDGNKVIFFNGQGGEFDATLLADKKQCQAKIVKFNNVSRESLVEFHLGQGLARPDRMDWVIQKATELGVKSITPLISIHCGVKLPSDRTDRRIQHWEKIAQSACEQSGRTVLPIIHAPMTLTAWSKQPFAGLSLYGDTQIGSPLNTTSMQNAYRLAIGPESGWDLSETALLQTEDFTPFSLGPRILRTETAGIVALGILQSLFGDLSHTHCR